MNPFLSQLLQELESQWLTLFPNSENDFNLSSAHRYPLEAGGKRVRPLFCLMSAGAIGGDAGAKRAFQSAVALECVHTYSLVHDDLPCMDNDDLRRGRPTTHKVFGEANALLVGDGLLTKAFEVLVSENSGWELLESVLVTRILGHASGSLGMVRGQWFDMALEKGAWTGHSAAEKLWEIHRLKTGALLGAAFEMGFVNGQFETNKSWDAQQWKLEFKDFQKKFEELSNHLGLFFQIQDDVLDATRSASELGKTAGKDSANEKLSAVSFWGLEKAQSEMFEHGKAIKNLIHEVYVKENSWKIELVKLVEALQVRTN
jgi:geranylgeranyl pyrophosphate synthase